MVAAEITSGELSCHVLAVTERGRSYVTAWVERQERYHCQPEKALGRPVEFRAAQLS